MSESFVTACDDTWLTAPVCVHFDTDAQMYSWRVSSEILWKSEGHPVERSGGTSNFDPLVEAICRDVEARLACTTNIFWRFSVAVTRWSRSTQLLYIEPG